MRVSFFDTGLSGLLLIGLAVLGLPSARADADHRDQATGTHREENNLECKLSDFAGEEGFRVGIVISESGAAKDLGTPECKSVGLLPRDLPNAKYSINYKIVDDQSDPEQARIKTQKLIRDDNVDAIIGGTTTPASLAMINDVTLHQVPMISLAASTAVVKLPNGAPQRWVFQVAQSNKLMANAIAEHMASNHIGTVGFIGVDDAYGDDWLKEARTALQKQHPKVEMVAVERYARTDTSVTGQVLMIMAQKPDAVLIAGAGTEAVLRPEKELKELGYSGNIYQTHGAATPEFLTGVGKEVINGPFLPVGPVLVAEHLPRNDVRSAAEDYQARYRRLNGAAPITTFGAHLYDADLLLREAVKGISGQVQPKSEDFRRALRDSLEKTSGVAVSNGIIRFSESSHDGLDDCTCARVMVQVKDGAWVVQTEPNQRVSQGESSPRGG